MASSSTWKLQTIDGGVLAFERTQGLNCLLRGGDTLSAARRAPRSLQIGLLTPCNLSCDFCYRDTSAPSRLTADFLIDLLSKAADWGVLEVSFGGGEPLLFKEFVPFLQRLNGQTPLGINFTTNGTLLTPAIVAELAECVGEIRVSAYADNHYRRTLRLLAGRQNGLNLLVTPANVGLLELLVTDALRHGARNVLLLGYKGPDVRLHLSPADMQQLRFTVLRMQNLPLRLDICWYPLLSDLPHLFSRPDCGAGDDFLVITPDRAVQACSFHHERIPFDTFEDLQRIYRELKLRRPAASIGGCTRERFVPLPSSTPATGLWFWQAHSSNNSSDWTIVGRFRSVELAERAAEALRKLSRAHEAFLASPEGHAWIEAKDYYGGWPTPPLQEFGAAHGFEWTGEDRGLWWEEDGAGAPVLTAGAIGDTVVVYHPYCMGLPAEAFRKYFAAVGASEFAALDGSRPSVVAEAKHLRPEAIQALEHFLGLVAQEEYPSDVPEPPPWGANCDDPRVLDDEDSSAILTYGRQSFQANGAAIRLVLTFANTFAGVIALHHWLVEQGAQELTVRLEHTLEPLFDDLPRRLQPRTDLFPEIRLDGPRFSELSPEEVIRARFRYVAKAPPSLEAAVQKIPAPQRLQLAQRMWRELRKPGIDVDWTALDLIQAAGPGAAPWLRELIPLLIAENYGPMVIAFRAMAPVLPKEEAFALVAAWLESAKDRKQYTERLLQMISLENPAAVPLIEQWWRDAPSDTSVTSDWGSLAANSGVEWQTLRRWIEGGRPLSLVALDALEILLRKGHGNQLPSRAELNAVLGNYTQVDTAPRAAKQVHRVLEASEKLWGT